MVSEPGGEGVAHRGTGQYLATPGEPTVVAPRRLVPPHAFTLPLPASRTSSVICEGSHEGNVVAVMF